MNRGHPGSGNPVLAGMYFLKSAEINLAENAWLQRVWVLVAVAGITAAAGSRTPAERGRSIRSTPLGAADILACPAAVLRAFCGLWGVPIFVPTWWPFSHYNVRYGLQLLPAFAAGMGVAVHLPVRIERWSSRLRLACVMGVFALVMASYASIWRSAPVSLKEAQVNMRLAESSRNSSSRLAAKIAAGFHLLMYLGDHVGAVQQAGIPLKRVINEGNHRTWRQPVDPEGLWEHAVADPAQYADYVLAFDGDSVWQAVRDRHLQALVEIHTTGQARAVLYRAR